MPHGLLLVLLRVALRAREALHEVAWNFQNTPAPIRKSLRSRGIQRHFPEQYSKRGTWREPHGHWLPPRV